MYQHDCSIEGCLVSSEVVVTRASAVVVIVSTLLEVPCRRKAGTRLLLLLVQDSVMHCRTSELSNEVYLGQVQFVLYCCTLARHTFPRRRVWKMAQNGRASNGWLSRCRQ
jgi:hypothetical protein